MTTVDEAISELVLKRKIKSGQVRHDAGARKIFIDLEEVSTVINYGITTFKKEIKHDINRIIKFNEARMKEKIQGEFNF